MPHAPGLCAELDGRVERSEDGALEGAGRSCGRRQGGPTQVLMSHVREQLTFTCVGTSAGLGPGPGQAMLCGPRTEPGSPLSTPCGPASTEPDDKTVLGPCSVTQHIPRVVSRAWRDGCGEAPELFPETSWRQALLRRRSGPLPAPLPVSVWGLASLCSLSINTPALLF